MQVHARIATAASAGLLALALVACGPRGDWRGGSKTSPGGVVLPESKSRLPRTPPPPEWFWEPIDADVRNPSRKPIDLPVTTDVSRHEGATRIWDELPSDARDRLKRDGALVISEANAEVAPSRGGGGAADAGSGSEFALRSLGAFYMDLRERRVPHLITLDSLFSFTTLALERALAEVEDTELIPALTNLLEKLDVRLAKEEVGAGTTELADGYRVAHGVIAVARALLTSTTGDKPSPPSQAKPASGTSNSDAFANLVNEEKYRVETHAAAAGPSVLLGGIAIDYTRFLVPSGAARPGAYRSLAWLSTAPLSLIARSEAPGASIDVAQARVNARAALLLARLTDREVDPAIHALYTHTLRLLAFVWGAPDDLSLIEIDDLSDQAQLDLRKPENIANVTRVDKLRARALKGRAPAAFDGSGGAFRGGIGARVFGGHASADSLAMQALVGAPVGLAQESASAAPVDRLRGGKRVLPSTLDVMAWLGAPEARAVLRETHADAFDGYEKALANAIRTRPSDQSPALHASIYGSLIDALIAWANPTDPPVIVRSAPMNRARVESMLASWTMVRHTGSALARPKPNASTASALSAELRVSGGALPIYIEPSPDVIARLGATVRQTRRGFEKLVPLAATSNAMTLLVELEDLLRVAQKGAERHASDEALSAEEATALASVPARLLRIEEAIAGNASASLKEVGPVVATVYADPTSKRVLVSATGKIEPIITFAREPGKDEPVLVVGAHVSHHELIEVLDAAAALSPPKSMTDAGWRARIAKVPVQRAAFTASFRWSR